MTSPPVKVEQGVGKGGREWGISSKNKIKKPLGLLKHAL